MKYTKNWSKYDRDYGYDKQEYDIKLYTGEIIYNCYPNAGKFNSFHHLTDQKSYDEKNVNEIRLSENEILEINE